MNNNIGRFNGADAIQRMKAQQANAQPQQVDNQEAATQSSTTRKPVSKKDLSDLMKGKAQAKDLGELVDNKNKVGEAQEAHIADGIGGLTSNSYTQKALKDMGFTDAELEKWFTKDSIGNYKMRDDITYDYGNLRNPSTGTIKTLDELKERMGIDIRNQILADTGYPIELFELAYMPVIDFKNGKVASFHIKPGAQINEYGSNRVLTLTNEDNSKNIFIFKEDGSTYSFGIDNYDPSGNWGDGGADALILEYGVFRNVPNIIDACFSHINTFDSNGNLIKDYYLQRFDFDYPGVFIAPDGKYIVTFVKDTEVNACAIYNPEDGTYEWIIEPAILYNDSNEPQDAGKGTILPRSDFPGLH